MIDQSLAQPSRTVPEETRSRVARGLALYREHAGEIENLGRGNYRVPGCSGGSYTVSLAVLGGEERCSCPDFRRHKDLSCKHLIAATLYRAKVQRPAAAAKREAFERRHQRTA